MGWSIDKKYKDYSQREDEPHGGAFEVNVVGDSRSDLISFKDEKGNGLTMNIHVLKEIVSDLEKRSVVDGSKWRNIDGFAYEKRPYYVIFEKSLQPVLCWPNAGKYTPFNKSDFEIALLGEAQAVWTGDEGSDYFDRKS